MEAIIALVALTAMEIVLGIDNIVFIAVITSKLPKEKQKLARQLGLGLAMAMRVGLLLSLKWILGLDQPMFTLTGLGIPESFIESGWISEHVNEVSFRDLFLLGGGLFLVGKSVVEIHHKIEGQEHQRDAGKAVSFGSVLMQIAILDIVFSLDSVITAVGMAKDLWVMIVAIILAVGVMLIFAETVSRFVEKHPTLKMLAMSFLILIGVMLIAEGIGTEFNKGYIYFAMAFALIVEFLNLKVSHRKKAT